MIYYKRIFMHIFPLPFVAIDIHGKWSLWLLFEMCKFTKDSEWKTLSFCYVNYLHKHKNSEVKSLSARFYNAKKSSACNIYTEC